MIRSWIGIVCVLVFVTTCVQTTAAQARENSFTKTLRSGNAQCCLRDWIELADQSVAMRILSSDDYRNDFRFRAAPVKQSHNWLMPIVDVRPAKNISVTLDEKAEIESAALQPQRSAGFSFKPVVNWLWKTMLETSSQFGELRDQFEQIKSAIVDRRIEAQPKPADSKQTLSTGPVDYWNYYADCDRWNVVFAIPSETPTLTLTRDAEVAVTKVVAVKKASSLQKSKIGSGLHETTAQIADRWNDVISVYRLISHRSPVSQP